MTGIIKVHNRQIIVPDSLDAEIFIGKWKKEYNFDKLVDEKTVEYYVKDNQ